MDREGRPNSRARGYGAAWRKRRVEHLERVKKRQEKQGWPGGPWCECDHCQDMEIGLEVLHGTGRAGEALALIQGRALADTVDHIIPRRLFPLHLQGVDSPGGSDHPSNLRAMAHGHHSRRRDDKARRKM